MDHLNKEKLEKVQMRLWRLSHAFKGVAGIFRGNKQELPLNNDELSGLGELFNIFSDELSTLEDILGCGYDSKAITKD